MQPYEVIIPVTFFLTTAFIIFTFFYFRSHERQMMIEKGLSPEQINELFKAKRNPVNWLRVGIMVLSFGIGLGIGLIIDNYTGDEFWIGFLIFVGIGLGMIAAFYAGRKYDAMPE